jgi:hypothetical protein
MPPGSSTEPATVPFLLTRVKTMAVHGLVAGPASRTVTIKGAPAGALGDWDGLGDDVGGAEKEADAQAPIPAVGVGVEVAVGEEGAGTGRWDRGRGRGG